MKTANYVEIGVGKVSQAEIERTLRNVVFTMEVEGFHIPPSQREDLRRVLEGKQDAQELRQQYLEKAWRYGAGSDVSK